MEQSIAHHALSLPLSGRARNLLLGLLIFTVLVLLALVVLPPLVDLRDTAIAVELEHAQTLAVQLSDTENSLQQMQADARGYLIAQSPDFRAQYDAAATALPAQLELLIESGVLVDPALAAPLAELTGAIMAWQRESLDRQVALVAQGRLSDAAADLAVGESQRRFDAIRGQLQRIQAQIQVTEGELSAQASQARTLQTLISVVLGILGLAALVVVFAAFWRMVGLMRALASEQARVTQLAAERAAQLAAAERQNRQLTVLHAVASASALSVQPGERARNILLTIARALGLPADGVWIARAAPSSIPGLEETPRTPAEELLVQAVAEGQDVLIGDTQAANLSLETSAVAGVLLGARSGLVLPLRGRAQAFGALVLMGERPNAFDPADLAFYGTLAAEVGLVLDNARLYAEAATGRQRLQAIFDHSPAGLVVAEAPEGRLALVNHRAHALLGDLAPDATLRAHPLVGRAFRPGGEPVAPQRLPLAATLADGQERHNIELVIIAPDGTRVPVLTTSVPLRDDGGVVTGAVAVFQDLRQLREVERLKADFVALVSHELRTPLTAIKGCTETLLQSGEADPGRVHEFLQIIDAQSDRLEELIDNLLSLAQVEAGALRLRRTPVALGPRIQQVLRQQRERAEGLRIQADLPAELPPVNADLRRVEQVLHNLLDNAVKFSPEGGVITLSASTEDGAVRLSVRDQGPGIPPGERARVFERFYQIAQAGVASSGSGLGLAICKALVEAHGGQIGVADAPGGGAELWFTLPAETRVVEPQVAVRHDGATRVLVVDDDRALRRMLDRSLADAGYAVQTVVEAQGALDALTQQPPDLVLLDLMLPGVDGLALCRQLREWTNVPIIMLTARSAEQDIVRGLQLGADDYVTKPFRLSELLARMEAVLRRAQPQMEPGGISLIQIDHLTVDLAQRQVSVAGQEVSLTPTEYGILAYMAQHAGQVLTHAQILRAVWGETYGAENNYLWVHIAHLRQKIEADPKQPCYILTERGVGYRLAKG
ncbi:response regulator [Oscillochloris sp. ZM17-4]|uniref:response regulator n=1 Tax=Oscillochloris sp. ZM17-4 TaxID=2866714 RepID=UPI001C72BB27|nr:response regulator [Oscillochloris sp. ZM17-4]MBX0329672.1 response regulator [Oscillochloris sp. ZM17-4]